jgi:hypothetical protein
MSERTDDLFDEFVGTTRRQLDRRLHASAPLPDLAAVFQRAHELDPEFIDEDTLAHVCELAPVVPLRAAPQTQGEHDRELAPFTIALREQLEAGVAERRAREIPPPRFVRPRPLKRRSLRSLAAAAFLLVLCGGVVSAMVGEDASSSFTAPSSIESLELDDDAPALYDDPVIPQRVVVQHEHPDPVPEVPSKRKRTEQRDSDALAELDMQAQALWRAGDLDGAEQLFREIVRRGGRGRWAQLAYGELFSLAQRHPGEQREELWQSYLHTFPNGRYAEDARAGLCRRAATSERDACWTDYISQHPEGTHVAEARRALEP